MELRRQHADHRHSFARSVGANLTVEVRRAAGLTARRGELDGFAGAMTRLRSAYDALQQTRPRRFRSRPFSLMPCKPEIGSATTQSVPAQEIAYFHAALSKARAAVATMDAACPRLDDWAKRQMASDRPPAAAALEMQKQSRLDAVAKARRQADEAGK